MSSPRCQRQGEQFSGCHMYQGSGLASERTWELGISHIYAGNCMTIYTGKNSSEGKCFSFFLMCWRGWSYISLRWQPFSTTEMDVPSYSALSFSSRQWCEVLPSKPLRLPVRELRRTMCISDYAYSRAGFFYLHYGYVEARGCNFLVCPFGDDI
jgi:hypothetical protein